MRRLSLAITLGASVTGALVAASRFASAQAPSTWGAVPSREDPDAAATPASHALPADDAGAPRFNDTNDAGSVDATPAAIAPSAEAIDAATSVEAPDAETPPPDGGAGASAPREMGFNLGLRASLALPFGLSRSDPSHMRLADQIAYAVPIGADVGYFLNAHLYIGGYLLYGFALNSTGPRASADCNDPSNTCSANTWRFGASARWHVRPKAQIDPWAGLALGYSILNLEADDASGAPLQSVALHGLELSVLAGADFKPQSFYGFGPFVELSMGHFEGDSATAIYGYFAIGARLRTGL